VVRLLIPTIVVLTVGFERIKRKAASGKLKFPAKTDFSFSTRVMVFFRLSGLKYLDRQSSAGNFVSAVILPPKLPSSSGNSGDYANVQLAADRKQLVSRRLIENVIDYLQQHLPARFAWP